MLRRAGAALHRIALVPALALPAALAVVVLAALSTIGPINSNEPSTAAHCLTSTPFTMERSARFERAAFNWLSVHGYLDLPRRHAYGPLAPRFSDHSLVTGGAKRGEYSLTVWLHDAAAKDVGLVGVIGPIYVNGTIDPGTCAPAITGARGGWL